MRAAIAIAVALVAAVATGCGKKEGKTSGPGSGSGSVGSAAVVPPRDAGSKTLTAEQREELSRRIKAGVELRKQQKWTEAISMFQSALEISPGDPRVLSEMGWCAIKGGDVEKAKQCLAGLDVEPRQPEPTLELPPRPATTSFCAPGKDPCECIVAHAFADATSSDQTECTEGKDSPVPGMKVYRARSTAGYGATWRYLLDGAGQLVGVISGETEHGKRSETLSLDKAEVTSIGGHQVLWLQTTGAASATYPVGQEGMQLEDVSATYVTICILDEKTATATCPLRDVPVHRLSRTDRYETVEGKPKTERLETTLELTIAGDGTATVKHISGEHDAQIDAALGPHKLW